MDSGGNCEGFSAPRGTGGRTEGGGADGAVEGRTGGMLLARLSEPGKRSARMIILGE